MAKNSARGAGWSATRRRVLERDGWVCAYCGRDATTVDHIHPRAKGGTDDDANLVAACRSCNSQKKDKLMIRTNYVSKRWLEWV